MRRTVAPVHPLTALIAVFWVALGAVSLFVIVRVSGDYLTSVRSLQDFRWRVVRFEPPAPEAEETLLVLEVQNRSRLDLTLLAPEVFLWYGIDTVGKTYGYGLRRTVAAGASEELPFTIVINRAEFSKARLRTGASASDAWRASGTYKVTTPLTDFDMLYRLQLNLAAP